MFGTQVRDPGVTVCYMITPSSLLPFIAHQGQWSQGSHNPNAGKSTFWYEDGRQMGSSREKPVKCLQSVESGDDNLILLAQELPPSDD